MRTVVSLFSGTVTHGGTPVSLAPREREFLFCIAAREAGLDVSDRTPRVVRRAVVARIRAQFPSPVLQAYGSDTYRLANGVSVDLDELRDDMLAVSAGKDARIEFAQRVCGLLDKLRLNSARGSAWFYPIEEQLRQIGRQMVDDALGNAHFAALL